MISRKNERINDKPIEKNINKYSMKVINLHRLDFEIGRHVCPQYKRPYRILVQQTYSYTYLPSTTICVYKVCALG